MWERDFVDVIKVGNFLLLVYFIVEEIRVVIGNLRRVFYLGGLFVLVENIGYERVLIFWCEVFGGLCLEVKVNGGVDIEEVVVFEV